MLRALPGFWSVSSGARAVVLDGVLGLPRRQFVWASRLQGGSSLRGRAPAGRRLATGSNATVAKQAGSVLARTAPSPAGSSARGPPALQGVSPRRRQACSCPDGCSASGWIAQGGVDAEARRRQLVRLARGRLAHGCS